MPTQPTNGNDFFIGGPSDESFFGYPGSVNGVDIEPDEEAGDDRVYGRAGDDTMGGGGGDDSLYGDEGNDRVVGNAGDDRLFGGDGDDLTTGFAGDDFNFGGRGDDRVAGGGDDDRLYGGDGNDTMNGGSIVPFEIDPENAGDGTTGGRDELYGGAGNDYLYGGNGNDILIGGTGRDWLRGGQGADRFLFEGGFGDDRIADFQPGRDIVDLTRLGLTAADLTYSMVDALGDGSADDLLVTVAGQGSIALIRTEQSDLTATNFTI